MSVDVTSAQPLTAEQTERLTEKLNQTLSAKVRVNAKVDPSLLGGLVAVRVSLGKAKDAMAVRAALDGHDHGDLVASHHHPPS